MRNRIMLLAAAATVMLAACADDQRPTAPAYPPGPSARATAGPDVSPSNPAAGAKPTDQVGFTKVFTVTAQPFTNILRGTTGIATATCPAGSTPVVGYYGVYYPQANANELSFVWGGLDGNNGWSVKAFVAPTAFTAAISISVTVVCIQ